MPSILYKVGKKLGNVSNQVSTYPKFLNYLTFIFYYILTIELNFFVMIFDQDDDITAKVDHVGLYEAWLKNDRCEY